MANFVLKVENFRCHGNEGLPEPNETGIVELADPENYVYTIEPKITTLSYMPPELWQFQNFPIETMVFFRFKKNQLNMKIHFYNYQKDHPCAEPHRLTN